MRPIAQKQPNPQDTGRKNRDGPLNQTPQESEPQEKQRVLTASKKDKAKRKRLKGPSPTNPKRAIGQTLSETQPNRRLKIRSEITEDHRLQRRSPPATVKRNSRGSGKRNGTHSTYLGPNPATEHHREHGPPNIT